MPHYRKPATAPRDGTIIVGLFERRGKRAIAMSAYYDADAAEPSLPPPDAPAWQREMAAKHATRLRDDPLAFFRPISDSDEAITVGRMIGWRPHPDSEPAHDPS